MVGYTYSSCLRKTSFETWNNAIKEAGFEVNQKNFNSLEGLINAYKNEIKNVIESLEEGQRFTKEIFKDKSNLSPNSLGRTKYTLWDLIDEMDIIEQAKERYSKQYLLEEIKKVNEKCDNTPPKIKDFNEESNLNENLYYDKFGKWSNAVEEAGFEPRPPASETVRYGENHPAWKGGPSTYDHYYGPSWTPELKKEIRERDDRKCCACSMSSEEHHGEYGHALEVHHIKPSRDFNIDEEHEIANNPENLVTLCVSCHGKLERMWTDCNQEEFIKRLTSIWMNMIVM